MRGLISRACPPRESVLRACEVEMCCALANANSALRSGDVSGYAKHWARLCQLATQAAELVRAAS